MTAPDDMNAGTRYCTRCGRPLKPDYSGQVCLICAADIAPLSPPESAGAPVPQQPAASTYGAARSETLAASRELQPAPAQGGDYPWGVRFILFLRSAARLVFALNVVLLCLSVLGILLGGLMGGQGFGQRMLGAIGGVVLAVLVAAIGYFLIWLNYMFMMALPDYLACLLQIERNTRRA